MNLTEIIDEVNKWVEKADIAIDKAADNKLMSDDIRSNYYRKKADLYIEAARKVIDKIKDERD
jgi:hypothetical protein